MRFPFAFVEVNKCYRDITSVKNLRSYSVRRSGTIGMLMNTSRPLVVGAAVGLLISATAMALIWFGVAGVLWVGNTDLMYVFWPSSRILTVGWSSTIPGISNTVLSVAINCFLYMALAYALHSVWRIVRRSVNHSGRGL